jgi:hypothetical protein
MKTTPEEQNPIDIAIIEAVILSIPEFWEAATLMLERTNEDSGLGDFRHELSSPQNHPPVMFDGFSIFEATYKLDELFDKRGLRLRKVVYHIQFNPDNSYHWTATYAHDEK